MRSSILHRDPRHQPPIASAGAGVHIFTADGRRILDGSGGAAVSCLGHGRPEVIEAIQKQASALAYAHSSFFSSAPAEELAELLVGRAPGGLCRAYFVGGGSEAAEAAIKLARHYFLEVGEPDRVHIISRRQSYHGATLGALAAGASQWRRQGYEPLLADCVSHVSPAYAYRGQRTHETLEQYCDRLIGEAEAQFLRLAPQTVMAFLAETVVGATLGAVAAPPGYFKRLRALCDRHGALLILDEVMCGMGRTGTRYAWEQEGATPDIAFLAKGLAGGYQPIGAVLANRRLVEAVEASERSFAHGHTYMAHPVACAAALAVQRVIDAEELLSAVKRRGEDLQERLQGAFANHPFVGDIRGRGLFWGIEIVKDRFAKTPFAAELKLHKLIKQEAFRRGLACYPGGGTADGSSGDHVLLAPPFIIGKEHLEEMVDTLRDAIDAATSQALLACT